MSNKISNKRKPEVAKIKSILLAGCFSISSYTLAEPLEKTVYQALQNNPDMAIAIQQYYTTKSDVDIATGNFLPSIDLIADTGKEDIDRSGIGETDMDRTNAKLQLSVPLFRGFANVEEHDRATFGMQASYYQSLAQAEKITLEISKAYLDTLRAQEVVVMSLENLQHHQKTYDLVHAREQQGVADKADLSQIKGRLARAKANLMSARNNLRDAETTYIQLVGVSPNNLLRPHANDDFLPGSNDRAIELALANNQSLHASKLSIQAASASTRSKNAHNYPQFDLVADRTWKDDVSGFHGEEDEWRVLVEMNWNLYAGGRKQSAHKKAAYQEEAARMNTNRVIRDVRANVNSSWNAYKNLEQELVYLQEYVEQSKETEKLYSEQFKVGRRTLLDLLDSQNELFQARKSYVAADYDYLYAQYRVMASMSYILDALKVNVMEGLDYEG